MKAAASLLLALLQLGALVLAGALATFAIYDRYAGAPSQICLDGEKMSGGQQ